MKHLRSLSLLALVAAFGLVVTGCSDDVNGPSNEPVPGDDDYTAIDFDERHTSIARLALAVDNETGLSNRW